MAKSSTLGIDFGTTFSKMAWFNPRTHQAEPLRNKEQREQTPSVVYLGERETRIGDLAVDMLEDEQEREKVIVSVKRQLVKTPLLAIPGRSVPTVDVVAAILRKLKEDAEKSPLLQGQEVTRVVVTYPAGYDYRYRDKLREAGNIAGFHQIELLDEPTAAALAYAHMGPRVGNHVLVYDLGGGTFDLTLLVREDDDDFRLAMDPQGMERCGGDDFDEALYHRCDEIAREKLGRPVSLTGGRDLNFLHECRHWKERLSSQGRRSIRYLLEPGAVPFQYEVDRATFEDLIRATIEQTIRRTEEILQRADADGYPVDTLVLVGGSTNIPLVQRLLKERLNLQPLVWHYQDVAVALGAAYYANNLWGPENRYRRALRAAWIDQRLDATKIAELTSLANALELGEEQIADLEYSVMGDTKNKILARQAAEDEYRKALEEAWDNRKLDETKLPGLTDLAQRLSLTDKQVADLQWQVMGEDVETILARQRAQTQYREALQRRWADGTLDDAAIGQLADLGGSLHLPEEQIKAIECEVMGGTKEEIFARQQALAQYREAVEDAWADQKLNRQKIAQLYILAARLNLSEDQVDTIEREALGEIKEALFARQYVSEHFEFWANQKSKQYLKAVELAWSGREMDQVKLERLTALAKELALSKEQVAQIERGVMGATKEVIFDSQRQQRYCKAVEAEWRDKNLDGTKITRLTALAKELTLSKEQVAQIECEVMGQLKEVLLFKARLLQVLRTFQSRKERVYVSPNIPSIVDARVKCEVPQSEEILGLIDCDWMGSATILFGTEGIYYFGLVSRDTGGISTFYQAVKIPYSELFSFPVKIDNNQVAVGNGKKIYLRGSGVSSEALCDMLNAIKGLSD